MVKPEFELGQEVRVEFIGIVTKVTLLDGKPVYEIKESADVIISPSGNYIKESQIQELEEPEEIT